MLTKEKVLDVLKNVYDPELRKNLVELRMVGDIAIHGDNVTVEVKLTTAGCPLKKTMEQDIQQQLTKAGAKVVHVRFGKLSTEEKQNLARGLTQEKQMTFSDTRVIAIGSGKGGVGKSTITANLAVATARLGYRVGLLDADILGFSITGLMGIDEAEPVIIDENTILPIETHGVKVISMGNFSDPDTALIWRAPILNRMLEQFFSNVYWGELDYLYIDLPPATGDIPLTIMQRIPTANLILVTTPQASAAKVAARLGRMAHQMEKTILGVIENMAYFQCPNCGKTYHIFGQGRSEQFAAELETKLLGSIPLNPEIQETSDLGTPVALQENHSLAQLYRTIAAKIVQEVQPLEREKALEFEQL